MDFERDLYRYMDSVGKKVSDRILKEKSWTPPIEKDVRAMIEEFKKSHPYSEQPQNPEEPKKQSLDSAARPPDAAAKRPAPSKASRVGNHPELRYPIRSVRHLQH